MRVVQRFGVALVTARVYGREWIGGGTRVLFRFRERPDRLVDRVPDGVQVGEQALADALDHDDADVAVLEVDPGCEAERARA